MKYPITIKTILLAVAPVTVLAQTAPETGKEIFEQMCAGCHGTYGNGQEGTKSGFVPGSLNVAAARHNRRTG